MAAKLCHEQLRKVLEVVDADMQNGRRHWRRGAKAAQRVL